MTQIEKQVSEIVKALLEISPWPWRYHESDFKHVDDEAGAFLLKMESVNEAEMRLISASPLWLASLVVGWILERAEHECDILGHTHAWCDTTITQTLRDFSISPSDYEELKRRVER